MTTTPAPSPSAASGDDIWSRLAAPAEPNASEWVRRQLEAIDAAGTTRAADIEGMSIVVLTVLGKTSGKVRRVPLMRVEHEGVYAAVASKGGAPKHPEWYHNLVATPELLLQDSEETTRRRARLATEEEREQWWPRCVEAFPPYAEYQARTDRLIPVFLLEEM